jgi:hypothetical protein
MPAYRDSVFLNVPFDKKYARLFDALIFAVYDCGFVARSAREVEDSGRRASKKSSTSVTAPSLDLLLAQPIQSDSWRNG